MIKIKKPRKKMSHEEHHIQCNAVMLFRCQWPRKIIAAIPNANKRTPRQGKWMKDEGLLPGMPDLMIPEPSGPYHGAFAETKRPGGKLTNSQNDFLRQLELRGYYCFCYDNVDDFMMHMKIYFNQGRKK